MDAGAPLARQGAGLSAAALGCGGNRGCGDESDGTEPASGDESQLLQKIEGGAGMNGASFDLGDLVKGCSALDEAVQGLMQGSRSPGTRRSLLQSQRSPGTSELIAEPQAEAEVTGPVIGSGGGGGRAQEVVCKFVWEGERCEVRLPADLDSPATTQAFVKDLARRGGALLKCHIKPSAMRVEYKIHERATGVTRRVQLTPSSRLSELSQAVGMVVTQHDSK